MPDENRVFFSISIPEGSTIALTSALRMMHSFPVYVFPHEVPLFETKTILQYFTKLSILEPSDLENNFWLYWSKCCRLTLVATEN